MVKPLPRMLFVVIPHRAGWAVEHEGAILDATASKEEATASASRRARAASAAGGLTQVVIHGEGGYFVGAG